jgi:NAD(P)-dependent dehydrogenase (short-subunit alcohol dehydrogenase family)
VISTSEGSDYRQVLAKTFFETIIINIKKYKMNTKNKIALVTGGSRGLGRNMAMAIAKKGIDVMLTYHTNKEAADEVVAEIESLGQKAVAFQLDTSDTKAFDNFIKQATAYLQEQTGSPNFDYLINNAGTALYALAS